MQLSVPQKHLGPRSFFVCALSINLLLILSIDMYVPALPSMQRAFDVSAAYLNLTVFVFFAFCAVGVVLAGPVSDRFGRRPVLVAGCGLFAASSILCALAPNVEFLVAFRIGQALGYGAVSTIETAMIKDAYAGPDLKLAMTCLQSLIIIGPALAPFLGTFVLSLAGWRGIFEFLAVCGVIGFLLSLLISETHLRGDAPTPGVADSLRDMLRGVRALGGVRHGEPGAVPRGLRALRAGRGHRAADGLRRAAGPARRPRGRGVVVLELLVQHPHVGGHRAGHAAVDELRRGHRGAHGRGRRDHGGAVRLGAAQEGASVGGGAGLPRGGLRKPDARGSAGARPAGNAETTKPPGWGGFVVGERGIGHAGGCGAVPSS